MQTQIWLNDEEENRIDARTVWCIKKATNQYERHRIVAYCGDMSLSMNIDKAERLGRALLDAATARREEIEALGLGEAARG